jgi:hypothetical protein
MYSLQIKWDYKKACCFGIAALCFLAGPLLSNGCCILACSDVVAQQKGRCLDEPVAFFRVEQQIPA